MKLKLKLKKIGVAHHKKIGPLGPKSGWAAGKNRAAQKKKKYPRRKEKYLPERRKIGDYM